MRATAKWLLGVVTLWPPLHLAFLLAVLVVSVVEGDLPGAFLLPAPVFFGLQLAGILVLIGLLIGYLAHLSLNPRLSEEEQERWLAVLLLGSAFTMPVYWWHHVRPGPELAPPRPEPRLSPAAADTWPVALGPSPRTRRGLR